MTIFYLSYMKIELEDAREMDRLDPLAEFRGQFVIDDPDLIYLDGNSLGRLPVKTMEILKQTTGFQWGNRLIRSWNDEWIGVSERIGAKIARLVGARADEVILTDSTSINLFKLAYAVLKEMDNRTGIVSDKLNFPSDLYILQGLKDMFGNRYRINLAATPDGIRVPEEILLDLVDRQTALVTVTHVCFKSSYMYDMATITQKVQEKGARMIWDLSHSTGAVPVDLNGSNADLAIGCTYKYLNGGPGSIAFLYIRKDLQAILTNPIWGWFADHDPFDFHLEFRPSRDIKRFQTSSPPILSLKAVEPGVDMVLEAGIDNLRRKSLQQSTLLIRLFDQMLFQHGFQLGSPRDAKERGSHVSLKHPEAFRICQAMIHPPDGGLSIIPDFRAPDNIRIGIAPLYNTFEEIFLTVARLNEIMEKKIFEKVSGVKSRVT